MQNFFYLIILFFLIGCKVDKDELKRLNNIQDQKQESIKSIPKDKEVKKEIDKEIKKTNELTAEQKYDLKKDEINKEVKLAKIKADSEIEIAKINTQNSIETTKIQKEIALKNQEQQIKIEKEKTKLYIIAIVVFAIVIIVALLIIYLINKRNNQTKLIMQEEEILKQKHMQAQEHRHESINKILDIISKGNVSKNVEKGLLEALKQATSSMKVIEDKSSKLKKLIFKD